MDGQWYIQATLHKYKERNDSRARNKGKGDSYILICCVLVMNVRTEQAHVVNYGIGVEVWSHHFLAAAA